VLGITKVVEVIKVADNTEVVNHPMVVTGEGHTKGRKKRPKEPNGWPDRPSTIC